MKKLFLVIYLLSIAGYAQKSRIYPKDKVMPGKENTFIYEPSTGVQVPENVFAEYLSIAGLRKSPLKKVNSKYEFTVKLPDSARTMLVIFKNPHESYVDQNNGQAFAYYFKDPKDIRAKADRLKLLSMGKYTFKLTYPDAKRAAETEALFKTQPTLKRDENLYDSYLFALKGSNPEKWKMLTEKRAQDYERNGDEKSLLKALNLYRDDLNNFEKVEALTKTSLEKYPYGSVAKEKYTQKFFEKISQPGYTIEEEEVKHFMAGLEKYANSKNNQFTLDQIKLIALQKALDEKDWAKAEKLEKEISTKYFVGRVYNDAAWKLADGDHPESPGTDLQMAEQLARKNMDIYRDLKKNLSENNYPGLYDRMFTQYTDTLAMILYKQKKYQEAFEEQSKIINMEDIDDGYRERYVLYAEKVKDPGFVKDYLYEILKERNLSDSLYNTLTTIYKAQNKPLDDIESLRAENKKTATKKAKEALYQYYGGDLKAKDFALTNLEGKKIKLSDYRGKIVVLDFWATWCGPCREALPHMQELVNQYKGKEVEFFFINTLENNKPEAIKKQVNEFVAKNKYNINVLYDFDNSTSLKYKVEGIPTEIIIGKDGTILSRSEGYDSNLGALISENL